MGRFSQIEEEGPELASENNTGGRKKRKEVQQNHKWGKAKRAVDMSIKDRREKGKVKKKEPHTNGPEERIKRQGRMTLKKKIREVDEKLEKKKKREIMTRIQRARLQKGKS